MQCTRERMIRDSGVHLRVWTHQKLEQNPADVFLDQWWASPPLLLKVSRPEGSPQRKKNLVFFYGGHNFFNSWWKVFGFFEKISSSRDLFKNEVFWWYFDFRWPHTLQSRRNFHFLGSFLRTKIVIFCSKMTKSGTPLGGRPLRKEQNKGGKP